MPHIGTRPRRRKNLPPTYIRTLPLWTQHKLLSPLVENPPESSAPMTVLGAMQTAPPRRASSSSYHISLISKPVPEVPQEHIEVMEPAEVPPRVSSPTLLTPASVSTHGGHGARARGDKARAETPPRKSVRVTRPYPILDETIRAPQPVIVPPGGFYPSRTACSG